MGKEDLLKYVEENLGSLKELLKTKIEKYRECTGENEINPLGLGKYFGVKVIEFGFPDNKDLYGYSVIRKADSEKEVYVSQYLSEKEKRYVMAQEVLYVLLVPGTVAVCEDIVFHKYESPKDVIANKMLQEIIDEFVIDILMPDDVFLEEYKIARKDTYQWCVRMNFGQVFPREENVVFFAAGEVAGRFGVPKRVSIAKMKQLGLWIEEEGEE